MSYLVGFVLRYALAAAEEFGKKAYQRSKQYILDIRHQHTLAGLYKAFLGERKTIDEW